MKIKILAIKVAVVNATVVDSLFNDVTPELNALISQLKNIFPLVAIAAVVWAKLSANAETDEAEAKKKNKRAKMIILSVPMLLLTITFISLFGNRL